MSLRRRLISGAWATALIVGGSWSGTSRAQYIVPQAPPQYGSVNLLPNQRSVVQGVAGGGVSLSSVDGRCRGYAQPGPSHVLLVPPGPTTVRIGAISSIDTTLMVQTPDGRILCDDDGGEGLNPLLEFHAIPGPIRVWVGSYSASNAGPYTLEAGAFGEGTVVVPSPSVTPVFSSAEVTLGGRPDPLIVQGQSGGPIQASTLGPSCRGTISGPPSHVVNARTGFPNLRFVVSARSDTTLVVRYPDGRVVCDDDSGGSLNPLVEGPTGPGQILVWVGTYGSGGSIPYIMGITTIPGLRHDQLSSGVAVALPPAPAPPPAPDSTVVVAPTPTVTARVDLRPRIPVTLIGPGMTPGTVVVWSPRGGPAVELGIAPTPDGGYRVYANIGGAQSSMVDVPADVARDAVVTVTQRPDQRLLVRAERAPTGGDPGQQMLMLIQMLNGAPVLAEQWIGTFAERAPRWAR